MFRKDIMGRRGGGVLYIKDTIQAYEVQLQGDFCHGNIKWDSLQSTGVEAQSFLCLVQDNLLTCIRTNQSSEGIRYSAVLTEIISRQRRNTKPLGSSDHNQLHVNINIKSDKTKVKQCRTDFRKGNYLYKEIR